MKKALLHLALLTGAAMPTSVFAQGAPMSAEPMGIGDIVVTAQKRSESAQTIPLAITAVGGDALRSAGVANVDALTASVPSLQLGQTYGAANVSLRGISLNSVNFGGENPIAFHNDGVFIARPAAVLAGFYDVARVEVLRGAQGTLYGRNATGGSINIVTADPTTNFEGFGQVTYGKYNHLALEGAVGGPLLTNSDKLLFRIAFRTDDRDGWGRNQFTGNEIDDNKERAVRAKLEFRPSPDLSILFSGDYSKARDHQSVHDGGAMTGTYLGTTLLGGARTMRLRDINAELDPQRDNTFWGVSANINYTSGNLGLRSITAYRESRTSSQGDLDQTTAPLISPISIFDKSKQFSQEFQLSGSTDRFKWLVGLYYFNEDDRGGQPSPINNVVLPALGGPTITPPYLAKSYFSCCGTKTTAYAAFGQATYDLNDALSLTLGGRYSIEKKDVDNRLGFDLLMPLNIADLENFNFGPGGVVVQCGKGLTTIGFSPTNPCVPETTFRAFTPKVGLEYHVNPSVLVYASYSKGFKSGVYNLGAAAPPVQPEKIDDYELGVKSTLFGGMLRANLAGFYYDYKDLQVNKVVLGGAILENAAAAKIYGLEAEIVARPTRQLQIDLNGSYLHTEFSRFVSADQVRPAGDGTTIDEFGSPAFNLKGNRLPQAPKFSGRAGASYTLDTNAGDFTLRGEVTYVGKVFFTPFNIAPSSSAARTRFNASLNYKSPDGKVYASLNAKNLGNKVRVINGFVTSILVGGVVNGYLEPPFTLDATVGFRF